MPRLIHALAAVLLTGLVFLATSGVLAQSTPPAFVPKTGTEGKVLMLAHLSKSFVITKDTPLDDITRLARVEGSEFVVDGRGEFPPKSFLQHVGDTARPVTLVLPLEFTPGHLRRLDVLGDFSVCFRISPASFTDEAARRLALLGPRRVIIEAQPADLVPEVVARLDSIRRFDLRLVIPEETRPDKGLLALMKAKTFAGAREIVLPHDFPVADIPQVVAMNPRRVVLRVAGTGPNPELARALNGHAQINTGAELRGLVKDNEVPNYLLLQHLTGLTMHLEGWRVTDEWVRLMNRRG